MSNLTQLQVEKIVNDSLDNFKAHLLEQLRHVLADSSSTITPVEEKRVVVGVQKEIPTSELEALWETAPKIPMDNPLPQIIDDLWDNIRLASETDIEKVITHNPSRFIVTGTTIIVPKGEDTSYSTDTLEDDATPVASIPHASALETESSVDDQDTFTRDTLERVAADIVEGQDIFFSEEPKPFVGGVVADPR